MIVYNIYLTATGQSVGTQALDDNLTPVLDAGESAQVIATSHGLDPAIANAVAGNVKTVSWGVVGTDASANAPAVPIAGYVLLATIAGNLARAYFIVQNQSAETLQVVCDDGFGVSPTSFLVAPGGGAGQQGGALDLSNEKGRVRIYGPPGSQHAARYV